MAEFIPPPLEFTVPYMDLATVTKVVNDAIGHNWERGPLIHQDKPDHPDFGETLATFRFYTRMEWRFALEEVRKVFKDEIAAAYRSHYDSEAGNLEGISSYWRFWHFKHQVGG